MSNANPYQFTGRENDGTGLYFYRARYYSPTFQRFIAQDPLDQAPRVNGPRMLFSQWGLMAEPLLFNPQRLGPYVYALNDPVGLPNILRGWTPARIHGGR